MKRLRLQRWGSQCLRPRIQCTPRYQCPAQSPTPYLAEARSISHSTRRPQVASAEPTEEEEEHVTQDDRAPPKISSKARPAVADNSSQYQRYFSETRAASAKTSAKLSALHARLSLPSRYLTSTLARALVHPTADASPHRNNESLAILGADLLGYYSAEHILCHYPRIPVSIMFAAQWAYVGPRALAQMTQEWGVEHVAEPGEEVDPGLLQCRHPQLDPASLARAKAAQEDKTDPNTWNRGMSWRIMSEDMFGEVADSKTQSRLAKERFHTLRRNRNDPLMANTRDFSSERRTPGEVPIVSLDDARTSFVRALVGGLYFHSGRVAVQRFFEQHVASRQLDLSRIFDFKNANLDLSRLCAREGFEAPVARLISESGRLSRHPVFVVGVYSGSDELGQGVGASLDEARMRASAAALRSWYLYSPMDVTKPSSVEGENREGKKWLRNLVDPGEVVT